MSWNFKLAGRSATALKAAVQAQAHCPPMVRDHLCGKIDGMKINDGEAILVESDGHFNPQEPRAMSGYDTMKASVQLIVVVDDAPAPVEAKAAPKK